MRADWRHVLFWLAVGCAALGIWVAWWAASGFPDLICSKPDGARNCLSTDVIRAGVSEIGDWAWAVAESLNHFAALITAIVTAILALVAGRLWRSTDTLWSVGAKSLEHAERTSTRELRAYISVEPFGIDEYIGQNYLIGHFRIRNFGKTPARDVSVYSTIALDSDARRTSFPIGAPRVSPTVLQPGAGMEFDSDDGWPIPADQLDNAEPLKLKGYVYVWGEVLYTDEFKTAGWTSFCHRYPCDMFGKGVREDSKAARANNHSIHRKFGRYHEEAGNEAG